MTIVDNVLQCIKFPFLLMYERPGERRGDSAGGDGRGV